jgi:DNA-binding response OmpR family regulator
LAGIMKGEVRIKSAMGMGAVFFVTIPLGKNHLKEAEYLIRDSDNEGDSIIGAKKDSGQEVLIVEDNKDLRVFIRENLSGNYRISEAEDGIRGLEKAQSDIPDLVISDVMMPGMDGMELCIKLKSDERTSHIPVILLTAKSTGDDKIEGLEQGADDYISKPFNIKELKVRIKNLLDQREQLRKRYSGMIGLDWGKMSVTTLDEEFLKKLTGIVSEYMHDSDFNVAILQDKMAMSREHLFRKLKALTGDSPSNLIRTMRLKTAAAMLENGDQNVTDIALNTGFSNSSSFAQSFKKKFGMTPGEYRKTKKK